MNSFHQKLTKLKRSGFTLLELLVVVGIIMILAAITLSIAGYVQTKSANARTKTELSLLEMALENYKADMGDYPQWTNSTPTNLSMIPATNDPTNYANTNNKTNVLRLALSPTTNILTNPYNPQNKVFFEFPQSMIGKGSRSDQAPSFFATNIYNMFVDPYGEGWGYYYTNSAGMMNGANQYDIWSHAGAPKNTNVWIKNW
ncbi:MAG: type II secretion system protein [Chthoniobacterales bacterium]